MNGEIPPLNPPSPLPACKNMAAVVEEDQPCEMILDTETESISSRDAPQESTETRPPKVPDKVALSATSRPGDVQLPRSKRHHHGHEAHSSSRRNTGDAADNAIQGTDRARKPRGERLGNDKFSLRPETPHHYAFPHNFQLARLNTVPPSTNPHRRPPRLPHSRDDADVKVGATSSTRADMDIEVELWRENAELRQALDLERNRAAQAERAADELRTSSRTKELQLQSTVLAVANDTDALGQELAKLCQENQSLKAELDDARSHIFSLQPYRRELTPKEVEQVSSSAIIRP